MALSHTLEKRTVPCAHTTIVKLYLDRLNWTNHPLIYFEQPGTASRVMMLL